MGLRQADHLIQGNPRVPGAGKTQELSGINQTNDRRSAAGRDQKICSGRKLSINTMDPSDLELRRRGGRNVDKAGEQRLVLDLGDEALMTGVLGIAVQQMVQLRRSGEREKDEPKQKHQPGGGALSGAERLLCSEPRLHWISYRTHQTTDCKGFFGGGGGSERTVIMRWRQVLDFV